MKSSILLFGIVSMGSAQRYSDTTATARMFCDMDVFCYRGQSTACLYTRDTSVRCDGQIYDLNSLKNHILNRHNELRQQIASAGLRGFQSAAQLPELKWNDELAQMALYHVKTCKDNHDDCRATKTFPSAGQNIAWNSWGFEVERDFNREILESIDDWFNEYKDANMNDINQLGFSGKFINHFLQVIYEQNTEVGCAAVVVNTPDKMRKLIFTCDYGSMPFTDQAVYVAGPAASKCKIRSSKYNALCATY